jgi:TetR/AcrR family fatty acid metabolism transcriptional regulator
MKKSTRQNTGTKKLMKTSQQVVSEFRCQEILAAARTVFAREGFAAGIVDDIAQEAGLAKGTLYLYFRSKRDIYKAVLQHDMETLKADALHCIETAKGLREKIRAIALCGLENAEAKREFFRIMDTDKVSLTYTRKQYHGWLWEPIQRLAAEIEEAIQRGEIRSLPAERVAWAITDMTRGVIQRRLIGPNSTTPSEDADFLVDIIWASLACKDGRKRRNTLP